jgi:hypothetical protein
LADIENFLKGQQWIDGTPSLYQGAAHVRRPLSSQLGSRPVYASYYTKSTNEIAVAYLADAIAKVRFWPIVLKNWATLALGQKSWRPRLARTAAINDRGTLDV